MHEVAAKGFAASVEAYRRSRPAYPIAAVSWLVDELGIDKAATVADVGAGTGKLTAQLVGSGASIVAVEPLPGMRAALAAELPGVTVVAGSAERMPMADGSIDAIVVGQAFHWFDLPRALPEFHRVLLPGGGLGVIWNELDLKVDWVRRFNDIIDVPRTGTPHPSTAGRADLGAWFSRRRRRRFPHAHQHDRVSLLDRVRSMSFVAVLGAEERQHVLDRVAELADTHPQLAGRQTFDLPYVTCAWWAGLRRPVSPARERRSPR